MGTFFDAQDEAHGTRVTLGKRTVNAELAPPHASRAIRSGPMVMSSSENSASHAWVDRACIVVPAFDAERTLGAVLDDLRSAIPECRGRVFVVDDGSTDGTRRVAEAMGCQLLSHRTNLGKGAALKSGLAAAKARGFDVVLSVDADGQHRGKEARAVLFATDSPAALVLGVRDLPGAGAPRANQFSNAISNFFLSRFAKRPLTDTQCGLRRYPVTATLALGARADGFDFEAEVLLRAAWAGVPIVERPVHVLYPRDRTTHFRVRRDPWRIIKTVVSTVVTRRRGSS